MCALVAQQKNSPDKATSNGECTASGVAAIRATVSVGAFSVLEEASGALGPQAGLFVGNSGDDAVAPFRAPAVAGPAMEDRRALIATFLAKSIYNLARRAN